MVISALGPQLLSFPPTVPPVPLSLLPLLLFPLLLAFWLPLLLASWLGPSTHTCEPEPGCLLEGASTSSSGSGSGSGAGAAVSVVVDVDLLGVRFEVEE